jgi:hypothetical protein
MSRQLKGPKSDESIGLRRRITGQRGTASDAARKEPTEQPSPAALRMEIQFVDVQNEGEASSVLDEHSKVVAPDGASLRPDKLRNIKPSFAASKASAYLEPWQIMCCVSE